LDLPSCLSIGKFLLIAPIEVDLTINLKKKIYLLVRERTERLIPFGSEVTT
jgi:hypothetical protein